MAVAGSSMKVKWEEPEGSTEEDTLEVDMSDRMGFGSFMANLVLNLVLLTSLTFSKLWLYLAFSFLACEGEGRC